MDRRLFERLLTHSASRRRFLGAGLAVAAAAVSRPGSPTRAAGDHRSTRIVRPQFATNPFSLGVASGDPLPDGIVLWTRLAPDPLNGGGMPVDRVVVRWEIAEDEDFRTVVQTGSETAVAELAHSVHADVAGLEPGRDYFYRFAAGDEISPTGRTKTAPAVNRRLERLRFASVSCANYEHGYFTAYRHLADEQIDFALCLGDYIYEYAASSEIAGEDDIPVRQAKGSETTTLAEYRNRYAVYRTDSDLQAAHAATPWIVVWDDHEVDNDYAGAISEQNDPIEAFLARRASAYQAYYEHMPVRPSSMPQGPDMRIYRRLRFGDLAQLNVLDTRQYRFDQPCGDTAPRCDAAVDPALTLLGSDQEQWLFNGLAESTARWNVIAQQVMMAQLDGNPLPDGQLFSHDQWDGYPLARQRLLDHLQAVGGNPIVLTGDAHSAWAADLKLDFNDESSPSVGTEFVTTSVTSHNSIGGRLALLLASNPHFAYFDARHGYLTCQVTPDLWRTDFRAVASVATPDEPIETIASYVVESGRPGATAAS